MRASDERLAFDLGAAGLDHLAARAAHGEFNEFFGPHADWQNHLIVCLKDLSLRTSVRDKFIADIRGGVYDATTDEIREWAASEYGQLAYRILGDA